MNSSQTKKTVYFIPGQFSDKRIFDSLAIDSTHNLKFIEYSTPEKKVSLKAFAKQISLQIDTSEKFMLVGMSLGGMICAELNEILNPEKVVIISSAKNRKEFPIRYRFLSKVPMFEVLPPKLLYAGAKFVQNRKPAESNKKDTILSMLDAKSPVYAKRTTRMIMNWKRKKNTKNNIIHIHGTKGRTLPLRKINAPDYIIKDGSHMMTLNMTEELSKILNTILV